MKKNIVRALALALVLIMALGIIPLAAFAADENAAWVYSAYYQKNNPTLNDVPNVNASNMYATGETIKVTDYNQTKLLDGKLYDFSGFASMSNTYANIIAKRDEFMANNPTADDAAIAKYVDTLIKNTTLTFKNSNIKIDPYPDASKYSGGETDPAYINACKEWTSKYQSIYAGYTPHQHSLSRWYSDSTTHWRECLVCKKFSKQGFWEQFMYQNWHSDGDENRICDVCGADIPYHEVTVIDSEGGKITVNFDEAPHRRKITASVEVEEGYKLKKLHFTKIRDDGSEQEITRYKKSGEFWTYMPTYDLEVTAEYIKK